MSQSQIIHFQKALQLIQVHVAEHYVNELNERSSIEDINELFNFRILGTKVLDYKRCV